MHSRICFIRDALHHTIARRHQRHSTHDRRRKIRVRGRIAHIVKHRTHLTKTPIDGRRRRRRRRRRSALIPYIIPDNLFNAPRKVHRPRAVRFQKAAIQLLEKDERMRPTLRRTVAFAQNLLQRINRVAVFANHTHLYVNNAAICLDPLDRDVLKLYGTQRGSRFDRQHKCNCKFTVSLATAAVLI